MRSWGHVALLLPILVGCEVGEDRAAIDIGQTENNGGYETCQPQVVEVLKYTERCSGTLIAPDEVLTASHCVATGVRPYAVRVTTSWGHLEIPVIDTRRSAVT